MLHIVYYATKICLNTSAHLKWGFLCEWDNANKASQPVEVTTYAAFVGQQREQFKTRFVDLRVNNQASALFVTLFIATVDSVAIHLQMGMIYFDCNTDLKTKLTEVAIAKFYKQCVPAD